MLPRNVGNQMEMSTNAAEVRHWAEEVLAAAERVRDAHFRLVWLAGGTSHERSSILDASAEALECPSLKVGRRLSEALLDLSPRLRAASAEEAFQDILLSATSDVVCLDHLEVLFDLSLRINAVDLIQNASRRFVLIASWPGLHHNASLSFGPSGHPACVQEPLDQLGASLITLS